MATIRIAEMILDEFEKRESEKNVRFMIIPDMIRKLRDRGFEAASEYIPEKKAHKIWAQKGDWNCVKLVDYYIHDKGADDLLYYARQRQEALDAIFEAYEDYKKKEKEQEMKNNKQKFTRDDLKPGYIVVLRNGKYYSIQMAGNETRIVTDGISDW